jgi:hypothetical protein
VGIAGCGVSVVVVGADDAAVHALRCRRAAISYGSGSWLCLGVRGAKGRCLLGVLAVEQMITKAPREIIARITATVM